MNDLLEKYFQLEGEHEYLFFAAKAFVVWNVINIIVMYIPLPDQNLKRAEMLDLRNRMVSIIHGGVSLTVSFYAYFFTAPQCGGINRPLENYILAFSCAYFFYDFIAMGYLGILDWGMAIHHWICILGMGGVVVTNIDSYYLVAAMFLSEVSNPPMHFRMILKHLGLRYSLAYEVSELSYISKISSK